MASPLTRVVACLILVVIACAPPAAAPSPTVTATIAPTASHAATASPTATPSPTPSPRLGPAVVKNVTVLLSGLQIPWAVELASDGRLFFTERGGAVRVARLDGTTATLASEPWANVGVRARLTEEEGLLGLALDPDFTTNHFVYLYYSYLAGARIVNRVVRMRDENGRGVDETILLDGIAGSSNHDGGRLKFGPDGKLYVTTGDGEVDQRAQDRASPNGKILRINTDGSIPADNPFAGSPVWSLGHRNVQGIAWQPSTGVLFETEHGPSGVFPACCNDEVNRIVPGGNYGWPTVVGQPHDARFIDPIATSGRTDTWAPSGATFLTHPGPLYGSFVFAALRGQHLHRIVFTSDGSGVAFDERLLQGQYGRLRDVYELPSGQLLVLTNNRDGRGQPSRDDDRMLLLTLE